MRRRHCREWQRVLALAPQRLLGRARAPLDQWRLRFVSTAAAAVWSARASERHAHVKKCHAYRAPNRLVRDRSAARIARVCTCASCRGFLSRQSPRRSFTHYVALYRSVTVQTTSTHCSSETSSSSRSTAPALAAVVETHASDARGWIRHTCAGTCARVRLSASSSMRRIPSPADESDTTQRGA